MSIANDLSVELPVLGVPVRFYANDLSVREAVTASFGQWRVLDRWPHLLAMRGVNVRLKVIGDTEGGRTDVTYDVTPARVEFRIGRSHGVAHMARREAYAHVTRELVSDSALFGYGVLEALTLTLVTTLDRQPVHGALLRRDELGIVLAGPSGMGKSSVGYLAQMRGFEMLSDDATYVQLDGAQRVWGSPGRSYVPKDVASRIAELRDREPRLLPSGKRKIVAALKGVSGERPPVVDRVGVCLLQRDGGKAWIRRVQPAAVATFLLEGLGPQRALYAATAAPAVEWLAGDGGWLINLSSDPGDGVRLLESVVSDLQGRGV